MMYASKIKMRPGCSQSSDLLEIDEIFISGSAKDGYYPKSVVYRTVKNNPGCIKVAIPPYPDLVPAVSPNGEEYVRSAPNGLYGDNLLLLQRE